MATKKVKKNFVKPIKHDNSVYSGSGISHLLFMLGQTLDFKIFGSLIVVQI